MDEFRKRTFTKTISWRIVATLITTTIVFLITRKLTMAIEVGLIEVTSKMAAYYYHDRIWTKINWGKVKHPLAELSIDRKLSSEELKKVRHILEELGICNRDCAHPDCPHPDCPHFDHAQKNN